MKHTLTALLIALTLTTTAQIIPKQDIKPVLLRSGLLMLSGSCDATAEVLRIDYSKFRAVHPRANEGWWNPNESWHNKWKNGDPEQGEAFLFSSTALVWTTDAYHFMRTGRNLTMISAIVIPIWSKKPILQYVAEFVIYYISYTTGFNLMFNGVYKMR